MADTTAGYPDALPLPEGGPRRIGRYTVLGELARGGMGVVFRAREAELDREVALKVLLNPDPDPRFLQEARAAARLEHPGIVRVHHMGEDHAGRTYLAMELVPGESLKAKLERDGPLPLDAAQTIGAALCDAIAYAHEQGVIHRDLKPHNVLLTPDGQVKITDFGLGKVVDQSQSLTVSGEIMGTPAYMPPEQALGDKQVMGPASDVYGVGATLYALLTGQPPFRAPTALNLLNALLSRPPEAPSSHRSEVPPELDRVVLRCLEKDPARRYPDARSLARALGAVGALPSPQPRRVSRAAMAAAVFVGAGGLAATLIVLRSGSDVTQSSPGGLTTSATLDSSSTPSPAAAATSYATALQRAKDFAAQGAYAASLAAVEDALRLRPDSAEAHMIRGRVFSVLGDVGRAHSSLTDAIGWDANYAPAYAYRAGLQLGRNDPFAAIEDASRALELAELPRDWTLGDEASTREIAYVFRGLAHASLFEPALAVRDFEQPLRPEVGSSEVLILRAEGWIVLGLLERGLRDLEWVGRMGGQSSARARQVLDRVRRHRQDLAELDDRLGQGDADAAVYLRRSRVLQAMGLSLGVELPLTQGLRRHLGSPELNRELGVLRGRRGDFAGGLLHLDRALLYTQDPAQAAAIAHARREVVAWLRERDPWVEDASGALARARRLVGDEQRGPALAAVEEALTRNPLLIEAHLLRARLYQLGQDYTASAAAAKDALALAADQSASYQALAVAQLQLGDLSGAEQSFSRALRLRPAVRGFTSRGRLRFRQGDLAGARADAERALALAPDDPVALQLRAALQED